MTTQWIRSVNLELGEGGPLALGGFAISSTTAQSLRFEFEITKDEKPWPNAGTIKVYNLNPDHRKYLEDKRGVPCRLTAGYRDGTGVLFEGYLREGSSEHKRPAWITTLKTADGELDKDGEPIGTKSIKKSFKRGTPVATIVTAFAKALNVDAGTAPAAASAALLTTGPALAVGLALDGPAIDELIYFMRSVGLAWSIQDGALQVRVADAPAGIAPIISPMTGLVGSPRQSTRKIIRENVLTKKRETTDVTIVEGKCLLLPELKPGHQIILQSESITGTYLCSSVKHTGDTHGDTWHTEFEGRA